MLFSLQQINWWTGVMWIIVMFLSAVWILILTAPIHCISPNLFWWRNKPINILDGLRVSKVLVYFCFWVNYFLRDKSTIQQKKIKIKGLSKTWQNKSNIPWRRRTAAASRTGLLNSTCPMSLKSFWAENCAGKESPWSAANFWHSASNSGIIWYVKHLCKSKYFCCTKEDCMDAVMPCMNTSYEWMKITWVRVTCPFSKRYSAFSLPSLAITFLMKPLEQKYYLII